MTLILVYIQHISIFISVETRFFPYKSNCGSELNIY